MSAPFLLMAVVWSEADESEALAKHLAEFPAMVPDGFDKGQVVSFRYDVADSAAFKHTLRQLDLAELTARPVRPPDAANGSDEA